MTRWRSHVRRVIEFCRRGQHPWVLPSEDAEYEICPLCFARRKRRDAPK